MAEKDDVSFEETQIGPDGLRHPTAELQKDNPDYKEQLKQEEAEAKAEADAKKAEADAAAEAASAARKRS